MSRWAALASVVLIATACGGLGTSSSASQSPSPVATKATSKPSPGLVFKLNGINTTAKGTITATTQKGSLTVELKITGLQTASVHASHIHIGNCLNKGTIIFALNQVVADGQGDADIRSTLQATYPPAHGTWYVVVHAGPDLVGSNATYLLCGNLFK